MIICASYLTIRGEAHLGETRSLEAQELAKQIVDIASDKQASDIVLLDLQQVSLLADYFVICSGGSERQIQAIHDDIARAVRREDPRRRVKVEGEAECGWVLMDFGDVVAHIFGPDEREYYRLEQFWSEARPVVRIQ